MTPIANTCRETVVLLRSKLLEAEIWNAGLRYALEDIETRLVVWIGNVGALALGNANLDYRLQEDPEMAGVLHSMLDRLKTDLSSLKNIDIQLPTLFEETESEAVDLKEELEGASGRDRELCEIDTEDYAVTHVMSNLPEEERRKDVDSTPPTTPSGHSSDTSSLRSAPSSANQSDSLDSEGNDDSVKNPQWNERLRSMNGVIDRLFRFAAVLRNPSGSSGEYARVRAFMAKGPSDLQAITEDQEFRVHVQWYLNLDRFKNLPTVLRDRFYETMMFRRAMILYRRRHQSKLAQGLGQQELPPLPQPTSLSSLDEARMIPIVLEPRNVQAWDPLPSIDAVLFLPSTTDAPMSGPNKLKPVLGDPNTTDLAAKRPTSKPLLSLTVASTANRQEFAKYQKSVIGSDITLTHAGLKRRAQLDIPESGITNQFTACPYCFQFLPEEETKGPKWSRHLLRDIKPYICLFPECGQAHQLFRTPEEWLSHTIQSHNTIWCCQRDDHENCIYDSREGLVEHFHLEHPDEFSEEEISQLVDLASKPSPDLIGKLDSVWDRNDESSGGRKCLLCVTFQPVLPAGEAPQIEAASDREKDANSILYEHLLQHFEELALKCLPCDGPSEDAAGGDYSALLETRQSGYLTSERRLGGFSDLPIHVDQDVGDWQQSASQTESEARRNPMEGFAATRSTEDLISQLGHVSEPELAGLDLENYDERVDFIYQEFRQLRLPKPEDDPVLQSLATASHARSKQLSSYNESPAATSEEDSPTALEIQVQKAESGDEAKMKVPELLTLSGEQIIDKHTTDSDPKSPLEKSKESNANSLGSDVFGVVYFVHNLLPLVIGAALAQLSYQHSKILSNLTSSETPDPNPDGLFSFCKEVALKTGALQSSLDSIFQEFPGASTAKKHRIMAYEYAECEDWCNDPDIVDAILEFFPHHEPLQVFLKTMEELLGLFSMLLIDEGSTDGNRQRYLWFLETKRTTSGTLDNSQIISKFPEIIRNFRTGKANGTLHEALEGNRYFKEVDNRQIWLGHLEELHYRFREVVVTGVTRRKTIEIRQLQKQAGPSGKDSDSDSET